jgi:hypothetical protein
MTAATKITVIWDGTLCSDVSEGRDATIFKVEK